MSEQTTPDLTVMGMELDCSNKGEISQPLSAVVIVKTLEDDGMIAYRFLATEGISTVEALGMVRFADIQLASGMQASVTYGDDGEAEG